MLFLHPGARAEFEQFESRAAAVMERHGGRIDRRIAVGSVGGVADPARPDEVHLVTFPDRESFARYRTDPEMNALAELRARAIRKTVVWEGTEVPAFT